MKVIKFFTVALCGMMVVSFSACNNDDDTGRQLTKEEKAKCFEVVKGKYEGNLIYPNENKANPKDKADTVVVRWNIDTDSTMTIEKVPAKVLAANFTNEEVKTAMDAASDQDVLCRIEFISTNPVAYLVTPQAPTYVVNYGGKEHKVQPTFLGNNYASVGTYNAGKKVLGMQLIQGMVIEDGQRTAYLKNGVQLVFESKKKL